MDDTNRGDQGDMIDPREHARTSHNINSSDIKPRELSLDISQVDFRNWIDSAKFFFRQCGIHQQNAEDQRNFFYTLIAGDMKSRLLLEIDENSGFSAEIHHFPGVILP